MKEKINLPLTLAEAEQILKYFFIVEDTKIEPKPTKKFWERHEKVADKIQVIIYNYRNHVGRTQAKSK